MGTMGHQLSGSVEYVDEANQLVGVITVNPSKWSAQDYFTGEIKKAGETVSTIKGNYMGYYDFDGVRYWDIRDKEKHFTPVDMNIKNVPGVIPSDASFRTDSVTMRTQTIEEAQVEKERLENL